MINGKLVIWSPLDQVFKLEEYNNLTPVVTNDFKTLKFYIGSGTPPPNYTNKPISTTIQDNNLIGATILGAILLDNVPMEIDAAGIIFDPILGELDMSVLGNLYEGQLLVITIF